MELNVDEDLVVGTVVCDPSEAPELLSAAFSDLAIGFFRRKSLKKGIVFRLLISIILDSLTA